ncbi:o-succinylbenzoate synthase [Lapillicoccus jejuensis]|uniref:o-succinylbenzoate synthase n=1 Tax=Lapillicoccus jejuensis TaxID=402171 RepID=A0A542DX63_9MICO|nr:o-succinylbenzoate synthase [Lapillicoccus jejuensis]TQJ07665.1 O-succinylbenzoate synthase [Lapillicoccus jejuensis]
MTAPLPPLGELREASRLVSIPLRVRFRGVTHREALLLRGPAGWGEFAPFLEYNAPEASRWLAAAVEAAYDGFPVPLRDTVPVNATVPALPADDVAGLLARYDGCRTAKVKVAEKGQTLDDDVARVAAVRDVMGPGARVRVDANGGWSVGEATTALAALAPYGLEYAEQPCVSVEELVALRESLRQKRIDVLVAADESVRKAEDPVRVARLGAADLVVVKVAPLGGVRRALEVVQACGLPAVVSSAIDTSVGIAAGAALAAALPDLPHDCGLGTVELLTDDVVTNPLVPVAGHIPVGAPDVDEDALERLAAPPDRVAWWHERLAACHAVLAAGG